MQPWQVEEGLPYNTVNVVLQDRRGYIWLATVGGLVRFNGVQFRQFTSPLVDREAARNIRALVRDNDDLLMLPATGGVVRWKDGAFHRHPMSDNLAGMQLDALFVEPSGAVWVGSSDSGFARWEKGQLMKFTSAPGMSRTAKASFATDAQGRTWVARGDFLGRLEGGSLTRFTQFATPAVCIAASRSGAVWVGSRDGLHLVQDGRVSTVSTNAPWAAAGGKVQELLEDRDGALWIGTTAHGLFRFSGGQFVRVNTSHGGIRSLEEDHEGSLWVATEGGGVNRLWPQIFQIFDSKSGLRDDVSDAVCGDSEGDIWLGNRNGGLAQVRNGGVTLVPLLDGRLRLNVNSVCADDRGQLWIGAGIGLYRCPRDTPTRIQRLEPRIPRVHVLFKERSGDIWVGADPDVLGRFRGDQFERFTEAQGFSGSKVRAIAEDATGGVWVGTADGLLFRMADGKFTRFTAEQGLLKAPMQALLVDKDGLVWVGTAGGLLLWRNDRFLHIGPADGLTDDVIYQLLEDDFGRLWFGSRRGIFHALKRDLLDFAEGRSARVNSVTFGKSEGLPGVYCFGSCQPMAWKSGNGWLWFATKQGVLALNPAGLKHNAQPPPVFVEDCLVNDHPLAMTNGIQIPPGRQRVEFRFAALSYAAPDKVRLRYRLEGFDADWTEAGAQRAAQYPGLPPGHYNLRVIACNNDGVWNERGAMLAFVVLPAWWQTWWFQAVVLLLFTGAVALCARYWSHRRLKLKLQRLEQEHALEKERTRIARDLHDSLGASLTQIGLLADMARRNSAPADELRAQSAQIAARTRDLARELDAVVWTVNPGNDTLGNLVTYLCQVSQELFRLLPVRCRLDVAEDIPNHPLTPEERHALFLVAKEAMNNVVKHSGATEVWMRMGVREGAFTLAVEDNGQGFAVEAQEASKRNGLRNMHARMAEFGGRFEIHSEAGKGTTVRLTFPLKPAAVPPGKSPN